jgi:hypothetical protein
VNVRIPIAPGWRLRFYKAEQRVLWFRPEPGPFRLDVALFGSFATLPFVVAAAWLFGDLSVARVLWLWSFAIVGASTVACRPQ